MSYKYRVKGQRYLRKYTAEYRTPVYSAALDASLAAKSMCNVAWESVTPSKAKMPSHTDKDNTNVDNRDEFDAALFCADHVDNEHRAYANAAAYVFKLDKVARKTLKSITVNVSSDPYNSNGARIAIHTIDSLDAFPKDCGTCRGENEDGSLKPWAAGRIAVRTSKTTNGKEYWYPATETCKISPADALALGEYLIVFVTMENYNVTRGNWLEGSSYIDNLVEIELDEQIEGWDEANIYDLSGVERKEYVVCQDGVSSNDGAKTCVKSITIQGTGDKIEVVPVEGENGEHQIKIVRGSASSVSCSVIATLDGRVNYFDVSNSFIFKKSESGTLTEVGEYLIVTAVGDFSQTSLAGIPGVLFLLIDISTFNVTKIAGGVAPSTVDLVQSVRRNGRKIMSATCVFESTVLDRCLFYICFDEGILCEETIDEDGNVTGTDDAVHPVGRGYLFEDQKAKYYANEDPLERLYFKENEYCHWVFQRRKLAGNTVEYSTLMGFGVVGNTLHSQRIGGLANAIPGYWSIPFEGIITNVSFRIPAVIRDDAEFGIFEFSGNLRIDGAPYTAAAMAIPLSSPSSEYIKLHPVLIAPKRVDVLEGFTWSQYISTKYYNPDTMIITEKDNGAITASGGFNCVDGEIKDISFDYRKMMMSSKYPNNIDAHLVVEEKDRELGSKVLGARVSAQNSFMIYAKTTMQNLPLFVKEDSLALPSNPKMLKSSLSSAYANFIKGGVDCSSSEEVLDNRVDIGFCVSKPTLKVGALKGECSLLTTEIQPWRLTAASSIIPFVLPEDKWFNSIKISKRDHSSTGGRINVWLKRDEYLTEIPDISDASYYLGDKNNVGGWELIAQLSHHSYEDDIIKIPTLKGRVATLLLTAYMPIEDVVIPTEYIEGEEVAVAPQGTDTNLDCNDVVSERLEPTISGAWKPTITLIG